MYIVISKPKRISVKSGLVHMILTSRTIFDLLHLAGATCTGAVFRCNIRAIFGSEAAIGWRFDNSWSCNGQTASSDLIPGHIPRGPADMNHLDWLK